MKSRLDLWSQVLREIGNQCSVDTNRDFETIAARWEHEGDAVFDIALPAFGKDFERSLELQYIPRHLFHGWKSMMIGSEEHSVLHESIKMPPGYWDSMSGPPSFLGGFMDRVFCREGGLLLDRHGRSDSRTDHSAVWAIRQLTLMFGKIKVLPDDQAVSDAFKAFVEIDDQVDRHLAQLCEDREVITKTEHLKKVFVTVFGDACAEMDRKVYNGELVPGHGPGATADRKLGNQKYYQYEWTDRLESLFPFVEYGIPNHRYHQLQQDVTWLQPEDERPVRVVAVPKTAKGPRIIAIEPTCMQYMQQALARPFVQALESDPLSRQFVGFTDQTLNQRLACEGSVTGRLATLDLSEASDRVPNWLVEELFESFPWFSEAIQATRSLRASVDGFDRPVELSKFASMGSAMTFPVEAVVFATIVLAAISRSEQLTPQATLDLVAGQVHVYGDDIIVPAVYAEEVIEHLEYFGAKVNSNKSFFEGNFRESCGKEFYSGTDVSIVRIRQELPNSLHDVSEIEATVSSRNQLYRAGLWYSAQHLDKRLEVVLKGYYPYVSPESPIIGRFSFLGYDSTHWDEDLQRPLVKGFVASPKLPLNAATDEAALMKCLLNISEMPNSDQDHLTRSGRPRAVSMKLVKGSPA